MSGFCGYTGKCADNTISEMIKRLSHRGNEFTEFVSEGKLTAACCFSRVDCFGTNEISGLVKSHGLTVFFDGEIENQNELDLPDGISDIEIITFLYKKHGPDLVHHIQGGYAFLIYDFNKNEIFAVRDRLGTKPFYYSVINGEFLFASELKSLMVSPNIKADLNMDALEHYLTFQFSVLPESFISGIYKLMPAESLLYKDRKITLTNYWEPKFKPGFTDMDTAVSEIARASADALESCRSNEEFGSFLSGGVDSSFIAGYLKPKKCFTVGYSNQDYNETDIAKEFASEIGAEHIKKVISADDFFGELNKIFYYMDEPVADPAAVAFYYICSEAAKHLKIALSGEGPDEFFGGYWQYFEPFALDKISFIPYPIRRGISKFLSIFPFSIKGMGYLKRAGKKVEERFAGNALIFTPAEKKSLLKSFKNLQFTDITKPHYDKIKDYDDLTKMQYIDIVLWLHGDIFHQADRMSMAHSLLVKTPLTNMKVLEAAMKLPSNFRVDGKENKIAFRKAAAKFIPDKIAFRKKWGFPVPLRVWLKDEEVIKKVKKHFQSDVAGKFFHIEELMKILTNHVNGKVDNSRKIWTLLAFLVWYEEWIN